MTKKNAAAATTTHLNTFTYNLNLVFLTVTWSTRSDTSKANYNATNEAELNGSQWIYFEFSANRIYCNWMRWLECNRSMAFDARIYLDFVYSWHANKCDCVLITSTNQPHKQRHNWAHILNGLNMTTQNKRLTTKMKEKEEEDDDDDEKKNMWIMWLFRTDRIYACSHKWWKPLSFSYCK